MNSKIAIKFNYQIPGFQEIKEEYIKSESIYQRGQRLIENEMCTLVSESGNQFNFLVEDRFDDFTVTINQAKKELLFECNCGSILQCCPHSAAALIKIREIYDDENEHSIISGPYTRKEMIKRVLKEREDKAAKEDLQIIFGDNIYGFHKIKSASKKTYEITIRDFNTHNGYCSCPDFKTNKLGTCKHLIFATGQIIKKYSVSEIVKEHVYPFVEIYCDPNYDYNITYYFERDIQPETDRLIHKYFNGNQYILSENYSDFLNFFIEAAEHKSILIRPEVNKKIDKYFEHQSIAKLSGNVTPDFSKIKVDLFEYQKESILFSLFKKGNIIADEMGLGKTVQAIAIALFKKDIYGFRKTLVICPASLKHQWKKEIERFTDEKAVIIEGTRDNRQAIYRNNDTYFMIANYEAVMRDVTVIHQYPPDLIILDEAQKIKNYDTKTSSAVKSIPKKHSLVITGTPLENKLLDLYSIMNFIEPEILAPQWEFSMNHCLFDKSKKNRITGYYNLQTLKDKLSNYIIRREKKDVFKELPAVQEVFVPVELHQVQAEIHAGLAKSLAPILHKKHKTIYDMQRIQQILMSMRMVCDSTYLIDKETNYSPKLDELETILLEKLDIKSKKRKVIIFSEWKTMLHLISKMLKTNNIQHVTLSGDVPVKKRGFLIEEFANNPDALVFLSTEAGGTGLNLQFADTVINFDLPWNPAKKNQRIGRINRIGQESLKLTAVNLVALNSIEENIANGIVVKEALFNAVLNEGNLTDEVDFAAKGRSTFIEQVQKLIEPIAVSAPKHDEIIDEGIDDLLAEVEEEHSIDEGFIGQKEEKESDVINESKKQKTPEPEEIETTLNHGMQFLNGVFQMATGKELIADGQGISVNKETGEVIMKFKLPGY